MEHSGLRFVHAAKQLGIPVAAINLGVMRADAELDYKLVDACSPALQQLSAMLASSAHKKSRARNDIPWHGFKSLRGAQT